MREIVAISRTKYRMGEMGSWRLVTAFVLSIYLAHLSFGHPPLDFSSLSTTLLGARSHANNYLF